MNIYNLSHMDSNLPWTTRGTSKEIFVIYSMSMLMTLSLLRSYSSAVLCLSASIYSSNTDKAYLSIFFYFHAKI